ncbi:MAG: hypothetical protein ACRCZJ_02780 [Erysipelotrichaceae bacterium]
MPKDKKIIVVAGCLLNPHCRVHVLGKNFPLAHEFSAYLMNHQVGMIPYQCPEFTLGGLNRNPQGMVQYDNMFFRKHCEETFAIPLLMIKEFINNGYRLCAVVGLQNSPSCGVMWKKHKFNKYGEESWMETGEDDKAGNSGIMMQEIKQKLHAMGLHDVAYIEYPQSSPQGSKEHRDFWYQVRRAVEPRNPYLTPENAEDFRAYFLATTHRNEPELPYVDMKTPHE